MKVISSKPKGQRIFKSYKRPFCIEIEEKNWWFSEIEGQWIKDYSGGGCSSAYYCNEGFNSVYSLKAVKRLIHKWNVSKGVVFIVSLPWVGYEFKIKK